MHSRGLNVTLSTDDPLMIHVTRVLSGTPEQTSSMTGAASGGVWGRSPSVEADWVLGAVGSVQKTFSQMRHVRDRAKQCASERLRAQVPTLEDCVAAY